MPTADTELLRTLRIGARAIAMAVFLMFFAALFIREGWNNFVSLIAAMSPLIAAGVAMWGVERSLHASRQEQWWSRAQWLIELVLNENVQQHQKEAATKLLMSQIAAEAPSQHDKSRLHDLVTHLVVASA